MRKIKLTFFLVLALIAMHSIYIGQLVWPIAVPLVVHMHSCERGVAIVWVYPYILCSVWDTQELYLGVFSSHFVDDCDLR